MAHYHVTIHGADRAAMADLVRTHEVTVIRQTLAEGDAGYSVSAIADEATINLLDTAGYRVERHEDVDGTAVASFAEVGPGSRLRDQAGGASTYLNVDEVEAALELAAGPAHADFTELITLPNPTWEGRTCRAIRIHHGAAASAGVYLLGGIHAREWGSPDICINFVRLLTEAYRTGTGISQGGKSFSAAEIRAIVERLDVIVFPQANPDGRHHSMTVDQMWRKNRRPAVPGNHVCKSGGGNGPGVDLNRNYDFLWDFPVKFSPSAAVATSTNPCKETYRGPAAVSEPETRNVDWLMKHFPGVGYFVDIHSFGEDILYNWGDDDDQTGDPTMNFHNPAYDGKRGILDSDPGGDPKKYREYLPKTDLDTLVALGNTMRDAIEAAHGRGYTVKSSANLYPTSGTSDDYAYSQGFLNGKKGPNGKGSRVLGFTIEWGPERPTIPESFHPNYADMVPIIEEVTAGLLAFCRACVALAPTN